MAAFSRSAWGLFILRLIVGLIFFVHGQAKLRGGIEQTAQFLDSLGIPSPVIAAWGIALLETAGGIGLMLGVLVPLWSVLFIVHMLTGIALVHWKMGFYVIGMGHDGYEFNLLLIAANFCLLLAGAGAWTVMGRRGAAGRI